MSFSSANGPTNSRNSFYKAVQSSLSLYSLLHIVLFGILWHWETFVIVSWDSGVLTLRANSNPMLPHTKIEFFSLRHFSQWRTSRKPYHTKHKPWQSARYSRPSLQSRFLLAVSPQKFVNCDFIDFRISKLHVVMFSNVFETQNAFSCSSFCVEFDDIQFTSDVFHHLKRTVRHTRYAKGATKKNVRHGTNRTITLSGKKWRIRSRSSSRIRIKGQTSKRQTKWQRGLTSTKQAHRNGSSARSHLNRNFSDEDSWLGISLGVLQRMTTEILPIDAWFVGPIEAWIEWQRNDCLTYTKWQHSGRHWKSFRHVKITIHTNRMGTLQTWDASWREAVHWKTSKFVDNHLESFRWRHTVRREARESASNIPETLWRTNQKTGLGKKELILNVNNCHDPNGNRVHCHVAKTDMIVTNRTRK